MWCPDCGHECEIVNDRYTGLYLCTVDKVYWLWDGDSRAYAIYDDKFEDLPSEIQQMILDSGLSEERIAELKALVPHA